MATSKDIRKETINKFNQNKKSLEDKAFHIKDEVINASIDLESLSALLGCLLEYFADSHTYGCLSIIRSQVDQTAKRLVQIETVEIDNHISNLDECFTRTTLGVPVA